MVGDGRGGGAGPWLAAGVAICVPATAFVWMVSRTWTPYLTLACVIGAVGVAMRFAHVFGAGAEHALRNRRHRDDARTTTMIEGVARPALLTDTARAGLYTAQAEALRAGMEATRVGGERREIPVSVNGKRIWGDGGDDEQGGWE